MEEFDKNKFEWKELTGSRWNPTTEGEEIGGCVVHIETEQNGKVYTISYNAKGDTIITPAHRVLQDRMISVKVGDVVNIIYKGEVPSKVQGKNPTKIYKVLIGKRKSSFNVKDGELTMTK